jgi:16S rRNA (guanine527-N7)-methyltransferase
VIKLKEQEFIEELKKLNIDVDEFKLKQLKTYCDFLIEYNKTTNLTAIKDNNDIYLKHFYDSLTITKAIDLNKIDTLLDVGSGAGFPGVVLKIFFPNISLYLLDSNSKKTNFLKELIEVLSLNNVNIINNRVEELPKSYLNSFDLVTARAVTNLPVLTELCLPFVKINGYFISYKGNVLEELTDSKYTISFLGGELKDTIKLFLPKENSLRTIIKIKKISKTKEGYPRKYNEIIKKALKKS